MTFLTDKPIDMLFRLDDILETPYFVPLAPGDALAVQFRIEALKGLTVDDVQAVFSMIERLDIEPGPDGRPDPDQAVAGFFNRLALEQPHIHERWTHADTGLVLDPVAALELAVSRGSEIMQAWMDRLADQGPSANSERESARLNGTMAALTRTLPSTFTDDRAFREYVRREILPSFPSWAGPDIYLSSWNEYIKVILDHDPLPELKAGWPY
jgi:hypothetical protein